MFHDISRNSFVECLMEEGQRFFFFFPVVITRVRVFDFSCEFDDRDNHQVLAENKEPINYSASRSLEYLGK